MNVLDILSVQKGARSCYIQLVLGCSILTLFATLLNLCLSRREDVIYPYDTPWVLLEWFDLLLKYLSEKVDQVTTYLWKDTWCLLDRRDDAVLVKKSGKLIHTLCALPVWLSSLHLTRSHTYLYTSTWIHMDFYFVLDFRSHLPIHSNNNKNTVATVRYDSTYIMYI